MIAWTRDGWEVECDPRGGRLTRVRWRGRDLLTRPHPLGGVFVPPDPDWGEYETRPVFGYDDCWPSLEVSDWPSRGRDVRDHGELCWLDWAVETTPETLTATVGDPEGEWEFSRVLSVVPAPGWDECLPLADHALRFDFICTNTGARPLEMTWAGHALVPLTAVRHLELPECRDVWEESPIHCRPVTRAAQVWPMLCRQREGAATMTILAGCGRPVVSVILDGLRWTLGLEGVPNPALALWCNRRGYPPGDGLPRDELGVEWMLTPECHLQYAVENRTAWVLAPGESRQWAVIWTIEETL